MKDKPTKDQIHQIWNKVLNDDEALIQINTILKRHVMELSDEVSEILHKYDEDPHE